MVGGELDVAMLTVGVVSDMLAERQKGRKGRIGDSGEKNLEEKVKAEVK